MCLVLLGLLTAGTTVLTSAFYVPTTDTTTSYARLQAVPDDMKWAGNRQDADINQEIPKKKRFSYLENSQQQQQPRSTTGLHRTSIPSRRQAGGTTPHQQQYQGMSLLDTFNQPRKPNWMKNSARSSSDGGGRRRGPKPGDPDTAPSVGQHYSQTDPSSRQSSNLFGE